MDNPMNLSGKNILIVSDGTEINECIIAKLHSLGADVQIVKDDLLPGGGIRILTDLCTVSFAAISALL